MTFIGVWLALKAEKAGSQFCEEHVLSLKLRTRRRYRYRRAKHGSIDVPNVESFAQLTRPHATCRVRLPRAGAAFQKHRRQPMHRNGNEVASCMRERKKASQEAGGAEIQRHAQHPRLETIGILRPTRWQAFDLAPNPQCLSWRRLPTMAERNPQHPCFIILPAAMHAGEGANLDRARSPSHHLIVNRRHCICHFVPECQVFLSADSWVRQRAWKV